MMDYEKLGLKVGLEVHQELDTEHKLFCACPTNLFRGKPEYTFLRRLRPSQSELGEIDPAALFEFMKGKVIIYEANKETSCLVEMDEEPPGPLNEEALDVCLTFALMTNSHPVDEVHVMRKTVVDGSNTTGFQRTCVISLGGSIEVKGKIHKLEHIGLEEDAARKISENGAVSTYRIDRLGIPLIEVATSPDIHSPPEAEEVALAIGRILRTTGKVRRGLGSIRQDVNISIIGGALIEIKGVQTLELISKVIEYEVERQVNLIYITSVLKERGLDSSDILPEYIDVSQIFETTESPILQNALKRGQHIFALKIQGFKGLIGKELCPNRRLGTEMADQARFWAGVRGIFHTDELPGHDISSEEVINLKKLVNASQDDAVVIVADERERCYKALSAIVKRAKEAIVGVPSETRSTEADGTTYFTRPRPGAARMYPETDIVSVSITPDRIQRIRSILPEMPEVKLERIISKHGLNEKLAKQIIDSDYCELFEELITEIKISPTLIAVTLTETLKSLQRDGVNVEKLNNKVIWDVFKLLDNGLTVKEALPEVFTWLTEHEEQSPSDALTALNLELISIEELKDLVGKKIDEHKDMVDRLKKKAQGPLMGVIMKEVRGKARAGDVQKILHEALSKVLSS